MAVWYIGSVQYAATTAWATGTAKSAGALIRQNATPTAGNERIFICIVAGTTHATTEPTWTVTKGAKTTDNTITWQECTGQAAVNGDVTNTPASSTVRSTNPGLGRIIKNNSETHYFICSTAGTCGAGEPTYDTTTGNTTTDSGATWTCIGAVGAFSAFLAPHIRLANSFTTNWGAAGDTFYVADDHAYSVGSTYLPTSPGTVASPCHIYCVDKTVAPPTSSTHLKITGSETTTGSAGFRFITAGHVYGLTFSAGSGVTNTTLEIGSSVNFAVFENCKFVKAGTSASSNAITVTSSTTSINTIILKNTTVEFGHTGDSLSFTAGVVRWINTPNFIVGATIPTSLLNTSLSEYSRIYFEGVDFSALAGNNLIRSGINSLIFKLINCKVHASTVFPPASPATAGISVELINCSSDTKNYLLNRYTRFGQQTTITNPVRTGGASDGTTLYAWNITSTADAEWVSPYDSFPLSVWNDTTAANRTVTLYGIYNSASLPNNDEIWMEVEYLGSSATPQASFATTTKAAQFLTGSALSADTSAWDTGATARANTTAYSLGDIIKVASNADRVFFCTTAGTTAGSEPGGYATAVDGDSITDNTAVFRAARRFTIATTLSSPQPGLKGYIHVRVNVGKASDTYYIDPKIVLS